MAPKSGDLTFTFEVSENTSSTLQLPLKTGDATSDLDYTITWNETETSNGPLSYTVSSSATSQTVTAKLQLHAGAFTEVDPTLWLGIEHLTKVDVGEASTLYKRYIFDDITQTYITDDVTSTYQDPYWGLNAKFKARDDGTELHDSSYGILSLNSLFEGAKKLQNVPKQFLVSVQDINNIFKNATVINDSNIRDWNLYYRIPFIDGYTNEPTSELIYGATHIISAISAFEGAINFDQPILPFLRNEEKSFVPNMTNISKNSKLSEEDSFKQGFLGVDTLDPVFLKIYIETDLDYRIGLDPYKTVYTDKNDNTYDYIFTLSRNSATYFDDKLSINLGRPFTIDEFATYTNKKEIKKMDLTLPDGTTSPFDIQTEQQAKENISKIFNYTNLFNSGAEFRTWNTRQGDEKIPIRILYHETGYFNNTETSEKEVSFVEIKRIEVKTKDEYGNDSFDLSKPETLVLVSEYSTEKDYKISTDKNGIPFVDSLSDYDLRFNIIEDNTSYNYFVTFKSSADEDYSDLAHWLLLDIVHKEHKGVPMLPFQTSNAKNYNLDNGQNEAWEVFGTSKEHYLGKLLITDDTTSMPSGSNVSKDILRTGIIMENGEYSDIISSTREILDSKKSTMRALQNAYTTHIRKTTITGKPASIGIGNVYDDSEDDADITWNFFRAFFSGRDRFSQALGNSSVKTRILYWQEGLESVDSTTDAYISYLEIGTDGIWRQFKKVPVDDQLEPAIYVYADMINRNALITDGNDLRTKINAWYAERDLNGVDAANALPAGDPKHFITSDVKDFTGIFYNKIGENHPDIRYWDLQSATSLYYMFQKSTFNNYITTWERTLPGKDGNKSSSSLKNVTNMSWLFTSNKEFNQSIGNWNTSSVTNMKNMFAEASKFNQHIGNWNTSGVTTMAHMFKGASNFNQNINTKLVTLDGVEYTAWDTKLVTIMEGMFERANKFNYAIQKWNTSNVITMENMFKGASMFNKSLSATYKTDNYEFPDNKTIKFKLRLEDTYNSPDDWQNNKWKNMTNDPTVSLYALIDKGVTIKDQDGNILTMREVEYFPNDTGNKDVEIDNIKIIFDDQKYDLEGVERSFREFTVDFTLGTSTKYYISSGDEMFDEMKISLTSLDEDYPIAISYNGIDAENKNNDLLLDDDIIKKRMNAKNDTWNTLNVRTMEQMFLQAESFNGNISNWDTSSVKTMHRMFSGFDDMSIDKIFYSGFAVTDGVGGRVKDNNYMVLSSDNTGENSFALASSRYSTWLHDKQQFPITFKEGGKITFSAKAPKDVIVYFGFNEDKTGKIPTTTYETNKVTITPTINKYEITIPPHNTEYYNVFLLLGTYDIMATITDVMIEYDNKKEKDYTRPMSFDKNIGAWDVRNVTNFKQMFKNNTAFDNSESDLIDGWKTAND